MAVRQWQEGRKRQRYHIMLAALALVLLTSVTVTRGHNLYLATPLVGDYQYHLVSQQTHADWRWLPVSPLFTHGATRQYYKAHIPDVLNHSNPYAGIAYRDEPPVVARAAGTELSQVVSYGNRLSSWYPDLTQDIASYIKNLAPNQLVDDGHHGIEDLTHPAGPTGKTGTTMSGIQTLLNSTKEINYYPGNSGWAYMWTRFNPTEIDADFARIQGAGFNTVRIILQATGGAFDYPSPTMAELNRLSQVIALANSHNLRVHLTLFDGWSEYGDITGSKQWADAIVKPYAGDARVSMIELQNELDTTNRSALSWAKKLIPYLKNIDGGIPVTVSEYGLSRMQTLYNALLASQPDFWDFHLYEYGGLIYSTLNRVKTMVHGAPLFIGETGYSTYTDSNSRSFSHSAQNTTAQEAEQEYYYRAFAYATQELGLPFAAPWIYSDFAQDGIPSTMTKPDQYYFGIYRLDGSAKPAVSTITSLFAGNPIDTSFNSGFERSDGQGLPTIWRIYQNASLGFTADFACDNTASHTGVAAAKISNSTTSTQGIASFYVVPVQYVLPGHIYELSAWVKGLDLTGSNSLSIVWFDANGNYLSQNFSAAVPAGTSDWRQLSVIASAPANAAGMEVHLNSQGNTGSVWFDDIGFVAN